MKKKNCSKCGIIKSVNKFYKSNTEKDGLQTHCIDCKKIYCQINKKSIALRKKIYDKTHKEEINVYYRKNKDKIDNQKKIYRNTHKHERKNYLQQNKKQIIQKAEKYKKMRFKTDINFKLTHYLRTRIVRALKGNPKLSTTMKLVGCSIQTLKQHLESKFKPGMSWSNYGSWHIDHIRPCASFDLSKPEEQYKCFHYTNLQPLWAKENLEKGCK